MMMTGRQIHLIHYARSSDEFFVPTNLKFCFADIDVYISDKIDLIDCLTDYVINNLLAMADKTRNVAF